MPDAPILRLRGLTRRYGGITALDDLDLDIAKGEVRGLIGPNGAGKSTLLDLLTGVTAPSQGAILLDGKEIGGLPVFRRAELGLARTFQTPQALGRMTVLDNVLVGRHTQTRAGLLQVLLRTPAARQEEESSRAAALDVLRELGLTHRAADPASALGLGERRLLDIARALAARPRLLLMDEPAAGLTAADTTRLAEVVRTINRAGVTVLLVEHDVQLVLRLAHRVLVLDRGRRLAEGTPQ
ncbi:MAG: ABC transporter ATP-binding protein, partial [Rhodopila sp.]|nr:ABC transporter ATP-binding protein [Rhodopila sp.]